MTSDNKYQLWLTFNAEKEKIRIPVLPTAFTVSMGTKDKSVDIIGLGEILIPQNRPAVELKFSSVFPAHSFQGVKITDENTPKVLKEKLTEWKNSKQPIHLIFAGPNIDLFCRITKFTSSEKGGDVGTLYYDLSLKEYREISVRKVTIQINKNTTSSFLPEKTSIPSNLEKSAKVESTPKRADNSTTPNTYTVQKGDTLWKIARKFYGKGELRSVLLKANSKVLGNSYFGIKEGQILTIPKISASTIIEARRWERNLGN